MQSQSLSQPSLKTQLLALLMIARKDWKVFWRYPLNAASQAFQPIIWLTPVYFMGKAFSLFMDCDAMIGRDFEKGLANVKAIVEEQPTRRVADRVELAGQPLLARRR